MIVTPQEAKERVLVELWLQSKGSLTVSDLEQCLRLNRPIVERAVAELVAEGQLVGDEQGYRWPVVRPTAVS